MTQRTILILDDGPRATELAERLTRLGYDVAGIATSVGQAAELAASRPPNLLLATEALHGQWTAPQSAAPVGALAPAVCVVMLEDPADMPVVGAAAGYLAAPFTDRELCRTMELALYLREAALSEREREDRFFTESIDLLCHLGFNGHFEQLNPAWERTLGFTLEELRSRPFIEFVHPDDRERTLQQNARVRAGGKALAFENRYLCRDGSYRWFRWNAAPDTEQGLIYSVARDVTEVKRAEEEREALVSQLQKALAEVRTLREILPICSYCRKIRDDENYWHTVESYVSQHTDTRFSHGICPTCMETKVEPALKRTGS